MCKNKHLSLDDRLIIERELGLGKYFKYIGNLINKDCTTISKEVRNHYKIKNSGGYGHVFNNCIYKIISLCNNFHQSKNRLCRYCLSCKNVCSNYKEKIDNLNNILVPLICEQNQYIHQAIINNKNKIMHSDKNIYKLIDLGLLEVKNVDLPRKVRFRERRKETTIYKIDKHFLKNRTYENFKNYIKENPDTPIVQMDSVIDRKGDKATYYSFC